MHPIERLRYVARASGGDPSLMVRETARLSLRLLGSFEARLGAGPLRLSAKKTRALLAYLALPPGRAHTRETLAGFQHHGVVRLGDESAGFTTACAGVKRRLLRPVAPVCRKRRRPARSAPKKRARPGFFTKP